MSERAADLVLHGGAVHAFDEAHSIAEAVAIRDRLVVAVGSDAEVLALAGPGTQDLALRGRMLLPGFQDAHVHASAGGLERLRCDLSEAHGLDEYRGLIRSYAASHRDEPWILGGGWSLDVFPGGVASRRELDDLVGDRPVFLSNRDHHGAWVNTRALEIAGVTASTPDPEGGRIERDDRGEPVGTLQEAAMDLVSRLVPPPTVQEQRRGIAEAQRYLFSLGITGWQEAIVGDYAVMPDCYDAYVAASASGELLARVVGALWLERGRAIEDQIDGLLDRRARAADGPFRATTVKIMLDGVFESFTAAMLDPYLDGRGAESEERGLVYFDPEELRRAVTRLDAEGFQVHVHAIGDRAVRDALDAVEAAREANGPGDRRHHLAHLEIVHPDDVPRFAQLGVVANAQPLWACNEPQMLDLTMPFLGDRRAAWLYPFGSIARAGGRLAIGSDWPVSSADPIDEIHVAVNRTMPPGYLYGDPGAGEDPLLPDEGLDLGTALQAFTRGSAYVNHADDVSGSIEVGKAADLVVLSRDLFDGPPGAITDATVEMTLVGGRVVFER